MSEYGTLARRTSCESLERQEVAETRSWFAGRLIVPEGLQKGVPSLGKGFVTFVSALPRAQKSAPHQYPPCLPAFIQSLENHRPLPRLPQASVPCNLRPLSTGLSTRDLVSMRRGLWLLAVLATLEAAAATQYDWVWRPARATAFGADASGHSFCPPDQHDISCWSIHKGNCGFGYIFPSEPSGWVGKSWR